MLINPLQVHGHRHTGQAGQGMYHTLLLILWVIGSRFLEKTMLGENPRLSQTTKDFLVPERWATPNDLLRFVARGRSEGGAI